MKLSQWIGPSDAQSRASYQEDVQTVAESLKAISDTYSLRNTTESANNRLMKTLARFKSLHAYDAVFFVRAVELLGANRKTYLVVVSINSTIVAEGSKVQRRETITEWEFLGVTELPEAVGEVYMRPETLGDKISEWFVRTEVDFDVDKEFSRRYYVLASDEAKLRAHVTPAFLSAIKQHKDLEIEIQGRDVLVRQKKLISLERANTISQVLYEIAKA